MDHLTTEAAILSTVEVVGTQIKGGAASEALLPVVGLPATQSEALGVTSGDDLFRSIPQLGEVTFRNSFGGNSSNFVRGDVGSINLRNLGVGNTLLLVNGRRTAHHPASQADGDLVPVLTYNANTIPVANLRRVDSGQSRYVFLLFAPLAIYSRTRAPACSLQIKGLSNFGNGTS